MTRHIGGLSVALALFAACQAPPSTTTTSQTAASAGYAVAGTSVVLSCSIPAQTYYGPPLAGGLGLAVLGFASTAAVVGFILFVIAMWRNGRLARWTVVVFSLSLPLLAIAVTFVTELLGRRLISTAVIAWKGWQESAVVA